MLDLLKDVTINSQDILNFNCLQAMCLEEYIKEQVE